MPGFSPYEFPELFDRILLGTVWSPGVVRLSGHDRDKSWDNKQAKGQSGATTTLNGDPIGEFQATFELVDDYETGIDEIAEWEEFQRLIESTTNGPAPVALPIYHPDLARNRYTEVTNASVGGMIHTSQGKAIVTVKFQEYRPPKPKPPAKPQAKPGGGGTVPGKPARPDPNAAAKAELAGLLEEAKKP